MMLHRERREELQGKEAREEEKGRKVREGNVQSPPARRCENLKDPVAKNKEATPGPAERERS